MRSELFDQQRPAWISVILIFLVSMLGFVIVGPLVGMLVASLFFDGNIMMMITQLSHPEDYPGIKISFFIVQGCATFVGLIIIPALYIMVMEKKNPLAIFKSQPIYSQSVLLTILVVIIFMIPNTFFIHWNANISLPDFMKGFETWAREKEELAAAATTLLTTFDNFNQFILAFVVMAVFAGIGEELVFRGMLQPELHRATGNIHAAIWISAILFSAIHMQFFGFVPRVLLGVLFGYLYYWSGNIFIPMLAHFVNNGFQVFMMYLYQLGLINMNMDSEEPASPFLIVLFTFFAFGILLCLKRFHRENNNFAS
ncbi:MAG TPA: CPBP family intramembrane glutamic endopeptidase [Cyclobacteriaceae bacterium]